MPYIFVRSINALVDNMNSLKRNKYSDIISNIKDVLSGLDPNGILDNNHAYALRKILTDGFFNLERNDLGNNIGFDKNLVRLLELFNTLRPIADNPEIITSMDDDLNASLKEKVNDHREKALAHIISLYKNNTTQKGGKKREIPECLRAMDEDMLNTGLITQEEYEADQFALMVAFPDYNTKIYDAAKEYINGGLKPERTQELLSTLGLKSKDDESKTMEAVYKLCLLSGRLQIFHAQRKADFKSKVKGEVFPDSFLNLRDGTVMLDSIKDVKDYHQRFTNALADKNLSAITPERFQKSIAKFEADHALIPKAKNKVEMNDQTPDLDSITYVEEGSYPNLLTGISYEDLNELSHNTGNLRSSNSESYNRMGDALADIRKKMSNIEPVTFNDYSNLFYACWNYMIDHDSKPTSQSGKNRFNAAARIAVSLSSNANILKANEREEFVTLGMIRSKVFRDAYVNAAQARLRKLQEIGQRNGKLKASLASEARQLMTDITFANSLDVKFGSKKMVTGKFKTDEARKQLADKYQDLKNEASSFVKDKTKDGLLKENGLLEKALRPDTVTSLCLESANLRTM